MKLINNSLFTTAITAYKQIKPDEFNKLMLSIKSRFGDKNWHSNLDRNCEIIDMFKEDEMFKTILYLLAENEQEFRDFCNEMSR